MAVSPASGLRAVGSRKGRTDSKNTSPNAGDRGAPQEIRNTLTFSRKAGPRILKRSCTAEARLARTHAWEPERLETKM